MSKAKATLTKQFSRFHNLSYNQYITTPLQHVTAQTTKKRDDKKYILAFYH